MVNEEQKNKFRAALDAATDVLDDLVEKADEVVERVGESIDAGVTAARDAWNKSA